MRQQTRTRKRQIKKTAVQQNKHTKEDTVKTVSFSFFMENVYPWMEKKGIEDSINKGEAT